MDVVVLGLGVAGEAVARRLLGRGEAVTVIEDHPTPASAGRAATLTAAGASVVESPEAVTASELVAGADLLVPSPGVVWAHPLIRQSLRQETAVWSEFELAAHWSTLPMVAVTGTDGKTTVTTLIESMLRASGLATASAGNNDLPLVDALELGLDVVVVEASSFRLHFTESFRPGVAVWLNMAEDHLDWHPTFEHYRAAKAKVWQNQAGEDVAVANADDPLVMDAAALVKGRLVTFSLGESDGWRVEKGHLLQPDGSSLLAVDELRRSHPHDLANAMAAAAAALAAGASIEGIRIALRNFRGLPHRVSLVGSFEGVSYYDDSKATTPHAVLAAMRGFDSVVLIAGGRNKGLDLSVLAFEADRTRAVVAIGEAADELRTAFCGRSAVRMADSMDEAVEAARALARPGDAVLLSPGCASFDWYRSYAERGVDFARAVRALGGRDGHG